MKKGDEWNLKFLSKDEANSDLEESFKKFLKLLIFKALAILHISTTYFEISMMRMRIWWFDFNSYTSLLLKFNNHTFVMRTKTCDTRINHITLRDIWKSLLVKSSNTFIQKRYSILTITTKFTIVSAFYFYFYLMSDIRIRTNFWIWCYSQCLSGVYFMKSHLLMKRDETFLSCVAS